MSEKEKNSSMADFDYHDALIQLEMLFQSHILSFGFKEYSLETFADRKYFAAWRGREGCVDTDEMRKSLNIDGILSSPDPSNFEVLTYLQYILNISELCRRSFNADEEAGYDFDIRNYTELLSGIRALLVRLGYGIRYVPEKEYVFLVPADAAAEAVEAMDADPLVSSVTEYRSSALFGRLDKKKDILSAMNDSILSYEDVKSGGGAKLMRRIGFLTGAFGITEGELPEAAARLQQMTEQEKESWYDDAFQLMLLRMLEHQNADRMKRVEKLAEECGAGDFELTEEEMAQILASESPVLPEKENQEKDAGRAEPVFNEETKEQRDNKQRPSAIRNVIIALIIADVLFMVFMMLYMTLR
jgi:hypothetical protein